MYYLHSLETTLQEIVGKLCSIVSIPGIAIGHGITVFWQSRHNDSVNMVCGCMTLTLQLDTHADSVCKLSKGSNEAMLCSAL